MTETHTPRPQWQLDADGYLYWLPTRCRVCRIGESGIIFLYDKKAKEERALTIEDLEIFGHQVMTTRGEP